MSDATPSQCFYMAGGERRGPFPFEQLLQQPIHRQTPVWSKGMSDWQSAGDITQLVELIPPAPPQSSPFSQWQPSSRVDADLNYRAKALRRLNFGTLVLILASLLMSTLSGNSYGVIYSIVAGIWIVVLWQAARVALVRWPWLWAIIGILPLVSYLPLIVLHHRLKRPLAAAGYRVSFLGRTLPSKEVLP